MTDTLIYSLLALFAGVAVTFQGPINTNLAQSLKSNNMATFMAFFVGTIILAIYILIIREPIPTLTMFRQAPWWSYLGAVTGIIYVFSVIIVFDKLGASSSMVLLILAQIVTALLLDHFGILGVPKKPINIYKIVGLVLMVSGVYLINKKW